MVRKLLRLSTKKHKKDCKTEALQSLYVEVLLINCRRELYFRNLTIICRSRGQPSA